MPRYIEAAIFRKTGGRCHFCGDKLNFKQRKTWQIDHVVQRAKGGHSALDNYLPAHRECNHLRWDRSGKEIRQVIRLGLIAGEQVRRGTELGDKLSKLLKVKLRQNRYRRHKKTR